MAAQAYTIYSGNFTDSSGNSVPMKVVEVAGRTFIIITDDMDMFLQGNLSDIDAGTTAPTGRKIVPLVSSNGDDYELDVTNPGVPNLIKKP